MFALMATAALATPDNCEQIAHVASLAAAEGMEIPALQVLQQRHCASAAPSAASDDCRTMRLIHLFLRFFGDPAHAALAEAHGKVVCAGGDPDDFANGTTARLSWNFWNYPDGATARYPTDIWDYPDGTTARYPAGAWDYPDGTTAVDSSGRWSRPGSDYTTEAELIGWACGRDPALRDAHVPGIEGASGDERILRVIALAWAAHKAEQRGVR